MVKTWDKEWAGLQSLAELLGDAVALPALPTLPSQTAVGAGVSLHTSEEISTAGSRWVDDEESRFYEDLLDLKGEVPSSLLGGVPTDEEAKLAEAAAALEALKIDDAPADIAQEPATAEDDGEDPLASAAAEDESPEDALPAGPNAQLTALFARLPEKVSPDAIDRAAVDFAFLNSKGARKRLIKVRCLYFELSRALSYLSHRSSPPRQRAGKTCCRTTRA
jgi:regulator of nonsense transcripts 2